MNVLVIGADIHVAMVISVWLLGGDCAVDLCGLPSILW